MADLVNTCRAQVPNLLGLLPFSVLKSWVVLTIPTDAPHSKIPRRLSDVDGGSKRNAARSGSHCPQLV